MNIKKLFFIAIIGISVAACGDANLWKLDAAIVKSIEVTNAEPDEVFYILGSPGALGNSPQWGSVNWDGINSPYKATSDANGKILFDFGPGGVPFPVNAQFKITTFEWAINYGIDTDINNNKIVKAGGGNISHSSFTPSIQVNLTYDIKLPVNGTPAAIQN